MGHGRGGRGGRGRGGRGGPSAEMRDTFHALLDGHDAIQRQVEEREDGVATVTTSEDPELVALIRRHVHDMATHMQAGGRARQWDPLFAALGDHYQEVTLEIEDVPGGVAVVHRGSTPEAVALVKAHADVVSAFVAHGFEEAQRSHALPR